MSMSENIYYIKADDTKYAVELIRKAGQKACILPEKNGWVTFVLETDDFLEEIIDINTGTLIYLVIAEDYEWQFSLFTDSQKAAFYRCAINGNAFVIPEENPMDSYILEDVDLLLYERTADWRLVDLALKRFPETFEQKRKAIEYCILEEKSQKHINISGEAYRFCKQMGLFFTDWICYKYLCEDDELDYGKFGKFPVIHVG